MTEVTIAKGGEKKTTQDVLRRSLRRLALATVLLYLILGGLWLKVYLDQKNTTKTLCTLRDDLRKRVDASVNFLADHPNGVPGIPAKTILDGIKNQRDTIIALNGLDCPTP
jgi:hypothetical protein